MVAITMVVSHVYYGNKLPHYTTAQQFLKLACPIAGKVERPLTVLTSVQPACHATL